MIVDFPKHYIRPPLEKFLGTPLSMGKGKVTILVLLDLSAAFDTVDHHILFGRLKKRHKIQGQALHWFKSNLTKRSQVVRTYV